MVLSYKIIKHSYFMIRRCFIFTHTHQNLSQGFFSYEFLIHNYLIIHLSCNSVCFNYVCSVLNNTFSKINKLMYISLTEKPTGVLHWRASHFYVIYPSYFTNDCPTEKAHMLPTWDACGNHVGPMWDPCGSSWEPCGNHVRPM